MISVMFPADDAFFFFSVISLTISTSTTDSISSIACSRSSSGGSSSASSDSCGSFFSGWRSCLSASSNGIVFPIFFFFSGTLFSNGLSAGLFFSTAPISVFETSGSASMVSCTSLENSMPSSGLSGSTLGACSSCASSETFAVSSSSSASPRRA